MIRSLLGRRTMTKGQDQAFVDPGSNGNIEIVASGVHQTRLPWWDVLDHKGLFQELYHLYKTKFQIKQGTFLMGLSVFTCI